MKRSQQKQGETEREGGGKTEKLPKPQQEQQAQQEHSGDISI